MATRARESPVLLMAQQASAAGPSAPPSPFFSPPFHDGLCNELVAELTAAPNIQCRTVKLETQCVRFDPPITSTRLRIVRASIVLASLEILGAIVYVVLLGNKVAPCPDVFPYAMMSCVLFRDVIALAVESFDSAVAKVSFVAFSFLISLMNYIYVVIASFFDSHYYPFPTYLLPLALFLLSGCTLTILVGGTHPPPLREQYTTTLHTTVVGVGSVAVRGPVVGFVVGGLSRVPPSPTTQQRPAPAHSAAESNEAFPAAASGTPVHRRVLDVTASTVTEAVASILLASRPAQCAALVVTSTSAQAVDRFPIPRNRRAIVVIILILAAIDCVVGIIMASSDNSLTAFWAFAIMRTLGFFTLCRGLLTALTLFVQDNLAIAAHFVGNVTHGVCTLTLTAIFAAGVDVQMARVAVGVLSAYTVSACIQSALIFVVLGGAAPLPFFDTSVYIAVDGGESREVIRVERTWNEEERLLATRTVQPEACNQSAKSARSEQAAIGQTIYATRQCFPERVDSPRGENDGLAVDPRSEATAALPPLSKVVDVEMDALQKTP